MASTVRKSSSSSAGAIGKVSKCGNFQLAKFVILGNKAVGKSCILARYFEDGFKAHSTSTIGIDFKIKRLTIGGTDVKIQIWDTAGEERFRSIGRNYYRGADGVILVYDVQDRKSFEEMENWLQDLIAYSDNKFTLFIVGNKNDSIDSIKAVSTTELKEFVTNYRDHHHSREYNFGYSNDLNNVVCRGYECSAKDDVGVKVIFDDLIQQVSTKIAAAANSSNIANASLAVDVTNLENNSTSIRSKCCK